MSETLLRHFYFVVEELNQSLLELVEIIDFEWELVPVATDIVGDELDDVLLEVEEHVVFGIDKLLLQGEQIIVYSFITPFILALVRLRMYLDKAGRDVGQQQNNIVQVYWAVVAADLEQFILHILKSNV